VTPDEPPSSGVPVQPSSGPHSGPLAARTRTQTLLGADGAIGKFFRRWALLLFCVFVLWLGRSVLLPFVFAGLIAYILAPIVKWMADRRDGTHRMPRGLAIIVCYLVFIAGVAGFMFLLVPRLSNDVARIGQEAPAMYKRINTEWTPQLAAWLSHRFPSLADVKPAPETEGVVADVPTPPRTAVVGTPLPDGTTAYALPANGIDVKLLPDGSFHIQAVDAAPAPLTLEDKIRAAVKKGVVGLQAQANDVLRFGQTLVTGAIRGIFLFFFTLMIGAFLLIDVEKVQGFLRSLVPADRRGDYDVIMEGIDRGLSGVIRGQLLICLINSMLTYVGLLVFGVKYTLILAVVAGTMSLIPIFGSILSSVPIVVVALVSGDAGLDVVRALAMLMWIIGVHFIEANLLNPKIMGTAAKIHPVLVIFALFLGEASYGLVGALLAVPVLSAVAVMFTFVYKKTWKSPLTAVAAAAPAPLPPTRDLKP
jgi:predicted PurR-regulated permease PerM